MEAKSSGWSSRWRNYNKKDMWAHVRPSLLRVVYGRIVMRAVYGCKILTMTPLERARAGLVDPKEMSTKREAHPAEKAMSCL